MGKVLYLLPYEVVSAASIPGIPGTGNVRVPRYFVAVSDAGGTFEAVDTWEEDAAPESGWFGWIDATDAVHSALQQAADVLWMPGNPVAQVGTNFLNVVRTRLEAVTVPGNHVQATDRIIDVFQEVKRLAVFRNRLRVRFGDKLAGKLDIQFQNLSTTAQDRLKAIALEHNIDVSSLNGASPVRDILRLFASQINAHIRSGGVIVDL